MSEYGRTPLKLIKQYQKYWKDQTDKMPAKRVATAAVSYNPKGKSLLGKPMKIWRDQFHRRRNRQINLITEEEEEEEEEDEEEEEEEERRRRGRGR
ncbi:hypothetical protein ANN_04661 [Periplaneta americana]|uniref:Uncharacterized protein n=1 Tax=Periplaneta americana TaxID=6978 RepID=A0ABQ8TAK2_PERAM|nr:hypothetical protein ANN_04661 [Periplaneta americana]